MIAGGLAVLVVAFVVAYAATASGPKQDDVAAPLLLGVLALVALASRLVRGAVAPEADVGEVSAAGARRTTWRPGLVAAGCVAVIAAVLATVIPSLPALSSRPASLNRTPPLTASNIVDPVDSLAYLRDYTPEHPVLTVDIDQPSTGYLAMAVLDQYDGSTWSFDTTFRPTGGRIPEPPGSTVATEGLETVGQHYTLITDLPVPLLPALDRPIAVSGVEAAADASTGMLLPETHRRGGLSYDVVSRSPDVTLSKVPAADGIGAAAGATLPVAGAISASDLALPPNTTTAMGTALTLLAKLTGQRPAPTVAFLQALEETLQKNERRVDPSLPPVSSESSTEKATGRQAATRRAATTTTTSVPQATSTFGTSLSQVINAITVYQYATPEQFATLFAMTARYLGVPARVVTGFRMASTSSSGPVPAGHHVVNSKQAWTWVEVPVAGLGWVVVDPTPERVVAPGTAPTASGSVETNIPNRRSNAVPVSEGGHTVTPPATIPVRHTHRLPAWLVVLLIVVGVLVLAALVGPGLAGVRRLARRRSRRRQEPSLLAVGAWLELLDGLYQAGMTTGRGDTSAEVAAEAGRHFSSDITAPVSEVGALAEQAVCSTHHPPDEQAATHAWDLQRTVRRTVHRGLDRRQRARALLMVGSEPRFPAPDPPTAASPPAASSASSTTGSG